MIHLGMVVILVVIKPFEKFVIVIIGIRWDLTLLIMSVPVSNVARIIQFAVNHPDI